MKSHGETIAEITVANVKGVPMEITGDRLVTEAKGRSRVIGVRGGARLKLHVQGGEPIRITADEIEWYLPASQPGARKK